MKGSAHKKKKCGYKYLIYLLVVLVAGGLFYQVRLSQRVRISRVLLERESNPHAVSFFIRNLTDYQIIARVKINVFSSRQGYEGTRVNVYTQRNLKVNLLPLEEKTVKEYFKGSDFSPATLRVNATLLSLEKL